MPPSGTKQTPSGGSSIVMRLNTRLFFRLLGIFFCMDLLLLALCGGGILIWAERQCAEINMLVAARGVPSAEATAWMEAGDYTVAALDRPPTGYRPPTWLPVPDHNRFGLRSMTAGGRTFAPGLWLPSTSQGVTYRVEMPNSGDWYVIELDLEKQVSILVFATRVLFFCQLISLIMNLLKNAGTIRKVLRPIQELAAAAARLGNSSGMSPEELRVLAGKLEEINATRLDARIAVDDTQRELKTLAEAINAMLDRINNAYRAQMRFVSDASHELRTPIAVIQGYANLLNRWGKDDPATMQEAIDAIRAESDAMKELVEQLLFLARGDNDSMLISRETFDLTVIAAEVLRETQMIDETHPILANWDTPVYVNADMGLMKQALRVLVDNAIKYTPAGGRLVIGVEGDETHARLSVRDEGQGIPKDALPHIFDRFYRTDESRARRTGGAGLGLPIAKWIVERHGGWFEVTSRIDVGTRMTIVLPEEKLDRNL